MPRLDGAKGNINVFSTAKQQNMAAGEKLIGAEWKLTFEGYPHLSMLFRTAQIPPFGRKIIEDFGPMGGTVYQWGKPNTTGELSGSAVETIKGELLKFLRKVVREKLYINVTMAMTPESLGTQGSKDLEIPMVDCLISSDVIDVSTEDTESLVNVPLLINYNGRKDI